MNRLVSWAIVPSIAFTIALSMSSAACAPPKPPTTSLRLAPAADAPAEAQVTIDDEAIGSLAYVTKHGVALPPGKHRITIELEGYLPWDAVADAGPDGGFVKLEVVLVRKPE
ncbi:MAG: PEGA domain-containing protein [Polyangiales bacterium]